MVKKEGLESLLFNDLRAASAVTIQFFLSRQPKAERSFTSICTQTVANERLSFLMMLLLFNDSVV